MYSSKTKTNDLVNHRKAKNKSMSYNGSQFNEMLLSASSMKTELYVQWSIVPAICLSHAVDQLYRIIAVGAGTCLNAHIYNNDIFV